MARQKRYEDHPSSTSCVWHQEAENRAICQASREMKESLEHRAELTGQRPGSRGPIRVSTGGWRQMKGAGCKQQWRACSLAALAKGLLVLVERRAHGCSPLSSHLGPRAGNTFKCTEHDPSTSPARSNIYCVKVPVTPWGLTWWHFQQVKHIRWSISLHLSLKPS